MRYVGGKTVLAKQIASVLNSLRRHQQPYWEPMCGGCSVAVEMSKVNSNNVYLSDISQSLIACWQEVQSGWIPPHHITQSEYDEARNGLFDSAFTGFVGYGTTFRGKWFGGFAPESHPGQNSVKQSSDSLVRKMQHLRDATFFSCDFITSYAPDYECLIYCDPPYKSVMNCYEIDNFDHDAFWNKVRWYADRNHTVVVSEYEAPQDFECIVEMARQSNIDNGTSKGIIEKLFILRS